MENSNYVILSTQAYENLLNYLGTTQVYNNVAKLISETVNDVARNSVNFSVEAKLIADSPETANEAPVEKAKMEIVEDTLEEEVEAAE
jgi:hypothetical protein